MTTITCKFSCTKCGIDRQQVEVKARTTESIMEWFEGVLTPALRDAHFGTSPDCKARSLSEVMIPMDGAAQVGGAPVPN